jgi:hypothetical protein
MKRWLAAAMVASAIFSGPAFAGTSSGVVFNFQFDSSGGGPDGTVTPPIVGTGTFSIASDPGNGTFALSTLGNYSMSYTFGNTTFTNADIVSNPADTLVVIAPDGQQRRVYFTDPGSGSEGPLGGSLDLDTGDPLFNLLSFEPSVEGGHNLYVFGDSEADLYFGNYLGLTNSAAVPEPASLTLGLVVPAAAGFRLLLRRRKPQGRKKVSGPFFMLDATCSGFLPGRQPPADRY